MRGVRVAIALLAVDLVAGTARGGPPDAGPAPAAERPEVAAARAKDVEAYEAERELLHRESMDRWAVLADGKVAALGKTLADVAGAAPDAAHRFVFRVGTEGDEEGQATTWYAARFAGGAFLAALGLDHVWGGGGVRLEQDGVPVPLTERSPFPRVRVTLADPGAPKAASPAPPLHEVFVGTVGPALMLTPDDAERMRLERWEVPGTVSFFGGNLPCRRALVRVAIPGTTAAATLIACWPTVPRATLVDHQRWRDKFWQWGAGGPLAQEVLEGVPQDDWIVFGNDRVLGHGKTPEEALTAADAATEFAYHRYAMRIPHDVPPAFVPVGGQAPEPIAFDLRRFARTAATLNGRRVEARVHGTEAPVYVVSPEDAAALRLEMAESPYRFRVFDTDDPKAPPRYARGGQAWTDLPAAREGGARGTRRGLALVLYERPREASDDPIDWADLLDAGMR